MSKIIKEIIILLLVCLVGLLLFAVVFYEYIPSRKIVPEIIEYSAPEEVQELLADDVENRNDQVVLTYKVTGSELNNYKAKKDYVPGRENPFARLDGSEEPNNYENNTTGGNTTIIDNGGTK